MVREFCVLVVAQFLNQLSVVWITVGVFLGLATNSPRLLNGIKFVEVWTPSVAPISSFSVRTQLGAVFT